MSSKAKFEPHRGQPFLVQASPGFLESIPGDETPETLFERREQELKSELARVLGRLPQKEADAISLWIHGMTQAEIAQRDGVTQAAVSIRAKRGLEKLFDMRDSGELGSLKIIWEWLHKAREGMAREAELERATDSDVCLGNPVGDSVGEEIGETIVLPDPEPTVPAVPDAEETVRELPRPARRTGNIRRKRRGEPDRRGSTLNTKEQAVLSAIKTGAADHIKQIESVAQLTNLQVRNSLRKLVRNHLVSKLGKGKYSPCSPSPPAAPVQ